MIKGTPIELDAMINGTLELETGLGALAGAVAVGTIGVTVAGPFGALMGASAGAVAGGLAGRWIARMIPRRPRTQRRRLSDFAEFSTSSNPDRDPK